MSPPEICPNCGAEVPPNARVCPECGADDETGWNDRATSERLGISDPDDFDSEEFAEEEFGNERRRGPHAGWIAVAVGLLAALLWWAIVR